MEKIPRHILQDGDTRITVLSMGCAVQRWQVGDRDVVLGYSDVEAYRQNPMSLGVICGRVVNRIRDARFDLNGTTYHLPANEPPNHVHGGPGGLGWRNWEMVVGGLRDVTLRLVSEDGDQGYPGRVAFTVRMNLDGAKLTWDMTAIPNGETPINLAQHLYFNLNGTGTILNHSLRIDADRFTPNGDDLLPVGKMSHVAGTDYDFRSPVTLGGALKDGWDANLLLNDGEGPAAEVTTPNGPRLRLWTNRPCLQLYTSNTLTKAAEEGSGAPHVTYGGLCLEAQDMPNAVNEPSFGSILCSPDAPYRQITSIEIA